MIRIRKAFLHLLINLTHTMRKCCCCECLYHTACIFTSASHVCYVRMHCIEHRIAIAFRLTRGRLAGLHNLKQRAERLCLR